MEKFHTDKNFLPNCRNEIDLSSFTGIKTEIGKSMKRPVEISIDSEYFRPKFQSCLDDFPCLNDEIDRKLFLNQLIECLKNPEGK